MDRLASKRLTAWAGIAVFLAGCGSVLSSPAIPSAGAAVGESISAIPSRGADSLETTYADALPVADQLLLGTILLEGTSHAVDAHTAGLLLPLWQKVKANQIDASLPQSNMDALVQEIQSSMTAEQIQAIAALHLTNTKLKSTLSEMGVADLPGLNSTAPTEHPSDTLGTPVAGATMPGPDAGNSPGNRTRGTPPASGKGPGDRPPQDGKEGRPDAGDADGKSGNGLPAGKDGGNSVATLNPEQVQTLQVGRGLPRLSVALLDVLLRLLEARSQA